MQRGAAPVVLAALAGLLCVPALTATARADALAKPTNVVARDFLTTGNRFYRLREFEKAIAEYKAGAAREETPIFYYNLGQCYRQLGRYEDAIWHYQVFLERGRPTGEVEASVRDFIAQMKAELEKKAMQQPPIEPAPSAPTAPETTQPAAPEAPAATGGGMPAGRKLAIALGVAGLAAGGVGLGLGLRGSSLEDEANEVCSVDPCLRAGEANELLRRSERHARYSKISYAAGGAALAGAVVLWLISPSAERKAVALVPHASPGSVELTVSVSF